MRMGVSGWVLRCEFERRGGVAVRFREGLVFSFFSSMLLFFDLVDLTAPSLTHSLSDVSSSLLWFRFCLYHAYVVAHSFHLLLTYIGLAFILDLPTFSSALRTCYISTLCFSYRG